MIDRPALEILCGDSRTLLEGYPDGFFNLIVASPPYADAREKQYHSASPKKYAAFIGSFHLEFWRVLAKEGSLVLNLKDKIVDGVRSRHVWESIGLLTSMGWKCVDDYIWSKPNGMPGYWPNRLRDQWEYCFHMTKNRKFAMYQSAVKKPVGPWAAKRLKSLSKKDRSRRNSDSKSGFGKNVSNWGNKKMVLPGNVITSSTVSKNTGHPAAFPEATPLFL